MNPETEQFESVRRLLALKRFEQPPPGYFDEFSVKVIARLQALQEQQSRPWWHRWLCYLEERPFLAGASGVACCGVLLCGMSLSQLVADTGNMALVSDPLDSMDAPPASGSSALAMTTLLGMTPIHASYSSSPDPAISDEPQDSALRTLNLKTLGAPYGR